MENGCIVERGDHTSLIAQDGVYKKLVLRQLTSNDDRTASDASPPLKNGSIQGED
jgi:hypothetical protein